MTVCRCNCNPHCGCECHKAALEQRENDIRHETVTKINKLLGIAATADLDRWEQLEEHVANLEQQSANVRGFINYLEEMDARYSPQFFIYGDYGELAQMLRAALNPTEPPR